jgi:hypothetical protein
MGTQFGGLSRRSVRGVSPTRARNAAPSWRATASASCQIATGEVQDAPARSPDCLVGAPIRWTIITLDRTAAAAAVVAIVCTQRWTGSERAWPITNSTTRAAGA